VAQLTDLVTERRRWFWVCAAGALLADLVTKALVWQHPDDGVRSIEIIPRCFHIVSHEGNAGGAFGFQGVGGRWFFIIAAAIGLVVIVWMMLTTPPKKGWVHAALGLLAGGALGNVYDRLFLTGKMAGRVRDFIDWHWDDVYHWPTFNLADSAICVGFAIIVVDAFFGKRTAPEAETPSAES
jgi:signal peptidase II